MSEAGAALQSYNNDLVSGMQNLLTQRKELNEQIAAEESEKNALEKEIKVLTQRLNERKTSLEKKIGIRKEYDDIISSSEAMYRKILESSQNLVGLIKSSSKNLGDKTASCASSLD